MRHLEMKLGLKNANCRNTVNMWKKDTQCMKTGCDREKVSWELFETRSG